MGILSHVPRLRELRETFARTPEGRSDASDLPPRLPARPIVGNLLEFRRDREGLLARGYRELGPVFRVDLAGRPIVALVGPELATWFFDRTDETLSIQKPYRFLAAMFGETSFLAPHDVYLNQRPVLHLPLRAEKVPRTLAVMQEEIQAWVDSLTDGQELELTGAITDVVQNVAAHAILGRSLRHALGATFWEHYETLSRSMDPVLPPNLPLPKFIRRDRAKVALGDMIRPLIRARRASPDAYDDMLAELANAKQADGTHMDEDGILSLTLGLVFAGHETTAGQAAWTILELARHPEYLEAVRKELDTALPEAGPPVRIETVIGSLKHLRWAVLETTRVHPSADMVMRVTDAEEHVGAYRIPKGWWVLLASSVGQRLEEVFTEPARFDPLRHSPERREGKHKHAITGFGGGLHKCVGMNFANAEMTIFAALLFRRFDVELLGAPPETFFGLGANRPTKTRVRLRRRRA